MLKIIRTNSENEDFVFLVKQLDDYLKVTDGEEHAFYNQFNNIDVLQHVIVIWAFPSRLLSGWPGFPLYLFCFKWQKRMPLHSLTQKQKRG